MLCWPYRRYTLYYWFPLNYTPKLPWKRRRMANPSANGPQMLWSPLNKKQWLIAFLSVPVLKRKSAFSVFFVEKKAEYADYCMANYASFFVYGKVMRSEPPILSNLPGIKNKTPTLTPLPPTMPPQAWKSNLPPWCRTTTQNNAGERWVCAGRKHVTNSPPHPISAPEPVRALLSDCNTVWAW